MKNNKYEDQTFLSLDITNKCGNRCQFCVVKDRLGTPKDMSLDTIESFLIKYKKQGFTSLNLHGGEPTEFEKLKELILLINKLGYKDITIQTNGSNLSNRLLVQFLLDNNVKTFVFSMHDCIPSFHNDVTGSLKSFEQATEGIKTVLELKGIVRTNTVLLKGNYTRISNIIDYLYNLGVRTFNLSSLNPTWALGNKETELFDRLMPRYKDLEFYIQRLLDENKGKDVKIILEGFPFCFLPNYNSHNLYNHKREIILLSYPGDSVCNYEDNLNKFNIRTKGIKCNTCTKNNICRGVWTGYVDRFGWEEFQPL